MLMRKRAPGRKGTIDLKAAKTKAKHEMGLAFDEKVADKVLNFLQKIRGLNSLTPEELDNLLYHRRFELLGPLNSSDAAKAEAENRLPDFSSIPNQHELHEALLGNIIPGSYQCVAHVLYPDSTPWPHKTKLTAPVLETDDEHMIEVTSDPVSQAASPVAPTQSTSVTRSSQKMQVTSPRPAQQSGDGEGQDDGRQQSHQGIVDESHVETDGTAQASDEESRGQEDASSKGADLHQSESLGSRHDRQAMWSGGNRHHRDHARQVSLRGQKISCTVRGKPVQDQTDDVIALYLKAADDERYNAAHAERVKLEKAVKLEQYQERKLVERIKTLEAMRIAEVEHQDVIRKRETRRQARKEELRKQLDESWAVRIEKEQETDKLVQQEKERKVEADKKQKRYHDKQKELLTEWQIQRIDGVVKPVETTEKETKPKAKTVKQTIAEEKVQGLLEAAEQRPPVPPRAHDLPRPRGLNWSEESSRNGSYSARARPTSWTVQAQKVACSFGLSPRESKEVESRLLRTVHGAGRMAPA